MNILTSILNFIFCNEIPVYLYANLLSMVIGITKNVFDKMSVLYSKLILLFQLHQQVDYTSTMFKVDAQ